MSNRERMKKAIEAKAPKPPIPQVAAAATPPVAAAATPPKLRRSAKARDARAKARGRLPVGTVVAAEWQADGTWVGQLTVCERTTLGESLELKTFVHASDGLFRLMEEMDVMFWEWLATPGDTLNERTKASLSFAPDSNPPVTDGKA